MLSPDQNKIIKKTVSKYKPTFLGVFGSYARKEQTAESDLDLLIDFNTRLNLLELIGIEQELSELLGIKVDLVTRRSVNKDLNAYIEKDLVQIL